MNNLGVVIENIEEKFQLKLSKLFRKRIIFKSCSDNGINLLLITPESVIHKNGKAWVDLTETQKQLFQKYDIGIIAFRLKNGQIFYINIKSITKFLNENNSLINKQEGVHWKLHINPELEELEIQKSKDRIPLIKDLKDLEV